MEIIFIRYIILVLDNQREGKTMDKELKQEFIKEVVNKVWGGKPSWIKYYNSKISDVLKTADGLLIGFDKPSIETRYCFSYDEHVSGSREEAREMCDIQEDYFIRSNLKDLKTKLKDLEEARKLYTLPNYTQSEKIVYIVTDSYKERFPEHGKAYKELNQSDREELIKMQEAEIEKFEKRLRTYLKKYGTSKLTTWTYSCWD